MVGTVKWRLYWKYFRASLSTGLIFSLACFFVVVQGIYNCKINRTVIVMRFGCCHKTVKLQWVFVCLFCLLLGKTHGISCACVWFWFCYDSKVKGLLVVPSAIILVIKQIRLLLRGRPFNLWYNHRSNCTPLSHINIIHLMSLSLLGWLRKLLLTRFRGVCWVCVFPIFPPSVTPLSWLHALISSWSRGGYNYSNLSW